MAKFTQRTIEYFFKKYKVSGQQKKEKLLSEVTDKIYDYNMAIVAWEKEKDAYKKKQLARDIEELDTKICESFAGSAAKKKKCRK